MDLKYVDLFNPTFKLQFPEDFKFELLPLHSPLLRQSLLVSFPPLIDMLKLSGWPRLTWGRLRCGVRLRGRPASGRQAAAARSRQVSSAFRHSSTVDRGGRRVGPLFRPAGGLGPRAATIRRAPRGALATLRDTQAGVPSA